jgi:hypothetical protein
MWVHVSKITSLLPCSNLYLLGKDQARVYQNVSDDADFEQL